MRCYIEVTPPGPSGAGFSCLGCCADRTIHDGVACGHFHERARSGVPHAVSGAEHFKQGRAHAVVHNLSMRAMSLSVRECVPFHSRTAQRAPLREVSGELGRWCAAVRRPPEPERRGGRYERPPTPEAGGPGLAARPVGGRCRRLGGRQEQLAGRDGRLRRVYRSAVVVRLEGSLCRIYRVGAKVIQGGYRANGCRRKLRQDR